MRLMDVIGGVRCFTWIVALMSTGSALSIIMVIFYPFAVWLDPRRVVYQRMLGWIARMNLYPYTRVICKGIENIPNEPCIFICNHQSFVDPTLITFPLKGILFQCLFKSSLIYAPGVGSTLLLCGHIAVDRANTKGTGGTSTKGALAQADAALANGTNVVFFVEGTRKIDTAAGPLGEFKPGAFWAAQKAQVPMVPMTISGARRLFPPGLLLLFGDVTITVHPPIPPPARGADAASSKANVEETMSRAKRVIASALRDYDCVESGNKAGHGAENEKDKERLIVSKSLPPSPARQVVGGGGGTCNTDAIMGMGDADAPMPMPIKKVSHKD